VVGWVGRMRRGRSRRNEVGSVGATAKRVCVGGATVEKKKASGEKQEERSGRGEGQRKKCSVTKRRWKMFGRGSRKKKMNKKGKSPGNEERKEAVVVGGIEERKGNRVKGSEGGGKKIDATGIGETGGC